MINLKTQLEEPIMKKVQEIITKSIEEKMELKIDDNLETNIENFTISHDDFLDYVDLISDLLSYSQMTLSKSDMNSYYSSLEKCDFTNDDFINYLALESQIWKVLDENVLDKEFVVDVHSHRLENDFDDFMTDNRKKVFELNLDQTEVWKELEPRIEKGIGKKKGKVPTIFFLIFPSIAFGIFGALLLLYPPPDLNSESWKIILNIIGISVMITLVGWIIFLKRIYYY